MHIQLSAADDRGNRWLFGVIVCAALAALAGVASGILVSGGLSVRVLVAMVVVDGIAGLSAAGAGKFAEAIIQVVVFSIVAAVPFWLLGRIPLARTFLVSGWVAASAGQLLMAAYNVALDSSRTDASAPKSVSRPVPNRAPRVAKPALNAFDRQFLEGIAQGPRGTVWIITIVDEPRTIAFATRLDRLLKSAGWDTAGGNDPIERNDPVGICLAVQSKESPPPHALTLQKALAVAGVEAPAILDKKVAAGVVAILVGRPA